MRPGLFFCLQICDPRTELALREGASGAFWPPRPYGWQNLHAEGKISATSRYRKMKDAERCNGAKASDRQFSADVHAPHEKAEAEVFGRHAGKA